MNEQFKKTFKGFLKKIITEYHSHKKALEVADENYMTFCDDVSELFSEIHKIGF